MPLLGNKKVGLQRHRRVNFVCEYSKLGAVCPVSVARSSNAPESAKQRRPLAPREELSVPQAEVLTPFEGGGGSGGLGLLLRSKRATWLAQSSRALVEGAKARLVVLGAGLAKSRFEALGKGRSLGGHRGPENPSSQKTAGLVFSA
jgi:hypothetical protein